MTATLTDLGASLGFRLGLGGADSVGLPESQKYVVLLVDGLGWTATLASEAKWLCQAQQIINSPIPSTTATGITCLTTGLAAGEHGLVGYTFAYPAQPEIISPLRVPTGVGVDDLMPRATIFERLAAIGRSGIAVAPGIFRDSGFTKAALRGAVFRAISNEESQREFISTVKDAASEPGTTFVYAYLRALDGVGHRKGIASKFWHDTLVWVDQCIGSLMAELPDNVTFLVTGDHGMIDVDEKVMIAEHPQLARGIAAFGGEGRFAHLYSSNPDEVAARWRAFFGTDAEIFTREEAISSNWFGSVSTQLAPRIGDVVAAFTAPIAAIPPTRPKEAQLIGMHGSITPNEREVPLLIR